MSVTRHMSRVEPKVSIQRSRTSVSLEIRLNIRLIIPSTEIRRVEYTKPARLVQHPAQERMRVKYMHLHILFLSLKLLRFFRQRLIVPCYLSRIWMRDCRLLISRRPVQWRQIHEEIGSVSEMV